ncbi:hypothetical protein OCU04_009017 [Sclerotinia nivalis]|uniref:Uncharacterized protein n=1 Tax=Sclerotinia nivalis TaxID=352851 RepID=A0A9X0AGP9_9HELO|nr:hypothetical protein OCU04_009017 [Sclerotinia nivalis]
MSRLEDLPRKITQEEVDAITERFRERGYIWRAASGARRADQAAAANVGEAMAANARDAAPRAIADFARDEPTAGQINALQVQLQQPSRQELQEAIMAGAEQNNALQLQLQQVRQQLLTVHKLGCRPNNNGVSTFILPIMVSEISIQ